MAKRGGNKGGSGIGSAIVSLIFIGIVAIAVFAYFRVANIHSFSDFVNMVRSNSADIERCTQGDAQWLCGKDSNGPAFGNGDGKSSDGKGSEAKKPETKESYQDKLNKVKVADASSTDSFSAKEWKHWILLDKKCDTRSVVLKSQGQDVKTDDNCEVTEGTWKDPYTGKDMTDPASISIDSVVPLKYAESHGADKWDAKKKEQFANDTSQLVAVSSETKSDKGDKGPGEWTPKDKSFKCNYAKKWIDVTSKYNLTMSQSDKDAIQKDLAKCR